MAPQRPVDGSGELAESDLFQRLDHSRAGGRRGTVGSRGGDLLGLGAALDEFFSAIPFPYHYALVGIWMVGGLLVPYVVRRPGAAFFGEVVAAFVSMALGNQWGILTMASGLAQGAGAELVFAAYRWKRFTGPALYGAAALAGLFSIVLDIFVWSYYVTYSWGKILVAAILCVVGSVVLGGVSVATVG